MFSITVKARFGDLDVLGHVNNTVPAHWFELARTELMKIFDPNLNLKKETFPLILAHTDYDFTGQVFIRHEIEIKTWVSRIGTKSFTINHEAWQQGKLCVKGAAVIVHYDFNKEQSTPIPEDKKKLLEKHLISN
ncbi:MAG: acyl-CoA thioesterase [Treponema sp.]|jgi:acyl-CoA thioester hydrolase|nr:acyl-CoA thioesterase [Treponema sp.]